MRFFDRTFWLSVAALWLLFAVGQLFADVTLTGPSTIRRDTFDDLRIDGLAGPARVRWSVQPLGPDKATPVSRSHHMRVSSDSLSITFAAPPGAYRVQAMAVFRVDNDPLGLGFDIAEPSKVVEVVDADEPPPPLPPDDRLPDGKYKLAASAAEWVRSDVPSANRADSKSLASSFRSIASAIAAGGLSKPVDILRETKASNNRAAGPNATAWVAWFRKLEARLMELDSSGELRQPADYQTAWQEIATGLESVR